MLEQQVVDMRAQAADLLADLQKRERKLRQQQDQWAKKLKVEADRREQEGHEALKEILDAMKPRDAKRYLMEWHEEVVVQLLRDMDDRKVSRILSECKTPQEQQRAAELMMRLREGV